MFRPPAVECKKKKVRAISIAYKKGKKKEHKWTYKCNRVSRFQIFKILHFKWANMLEYLPSNNNWKEDEEIRKQLTKIT